MMSRLTSVIHPRLRVVIAALWPTGAVIAGFTSVRAMVRIDIGRGMVFAVVALAPLRGHRVSVVLLTVALGFGLGAVWELYE